MKQIAFSLIAFLMAAAATAAVPVLASTVASQTAAPTASTTITLTDTERQIVAHNSDFAFTLFRKTRNTENLCLSPLSITYAIGMLNNGAEGITRQEISTLLGGADVGSTDAINNFCRKMLTESVLLDEDTGVSIANTIFFNGDRKDIKLKSLFKHAADTYYDATPSVLSFSDEATLGIMNQWATDDTDGMISDLLEPKDLEDPDLVSFLLNAVCFKGSWVNQFDEEYTTRKFFDDMKRTATMMMQTSQFRYAETDLYQSVIMPYGNGSYEMTLFLPRNGKTLDDVLETMNGKNWNTAAYKNYEVTLEIPRIETDTNEDLEEVMESLGMKNAFMKEGSHGFWNFCHFGDDEEDSDQCWISMMRQKVHLKLDEKGTEGAAATVVSIVDKAVPEHREFIADRPLLYIISERSTGTIFFIGQFVGEDTTDIIDIEQSSVSTLQLDGKDGNGQDLRCYDLQGRQILNRNLSKGLYIVGGKKVVQR